MATDREFEDCLFDRNPQLDQATIREVLDTIKELEEAGVQPAGYNLEGAHSRRRTVVDETDAPASSAGFGQSSFASYPSAWTARSR